VPAEQVVPDHVLRFWRALDRLFARVLPTRWGAVVTDGRFPAVWDANYARIDAPTSDLTLSEVEASLLPELRSARAPVEHLVSFRPDVTAPLFRDLEARRHRITWDLVLNLEADPPLGDDRAAEDLSPGPELWSTGAGSLRLFGVDNHEARRQLARIEREVLTVGGKRCSACETSTARSSRSAPCSSSETSAISTTWPRSNTRAAVVTRAPSHHARSGQRRKPEPRTSACSPIPTRPV